MRPGQRCAVAALLALVATLGIGALALLRQAPATGIAVDTAPAPSPSPTRTELAQTSRIAPPPPAKPERRQLLIEEVLAEEKTEDPGAIYFTSRIREAVREGNPAFARELLRQFKAEHPNSVLVYEAESLLESTR